MKIYYAASIWGAAGDANFNLELIKFLKHSATVLSEHLFLPEYKNAEHLNMQQIHDRDLSWVNEADIIIAECTSPSLGVGYELREAITKAKRVIILYKPNPENKNTRLSAMVAGAPGVTIINYATLTEVKDKLKKEVFS